VAWFVDDYFILSDENYDASDSSAAMHSGTLLSHSHFFEETGISNHFLDLLAFAFLWRVCGIASLAKWTKFNAI
jgi:hypothetical protein